MKILLTGASGQLGQELYPLLGRLGKVIAVDRQEAPGSAGTVQKLDLSDLKQAEVLFNRLGPDIIVNAAAYTAVDQAENEPSTTFRVNAELPACIARWAALNERLVFHYSTDYVFDGSGDRPYREEDHPSPLNVYGESKLAGEQAILSSNCRHIILRTSWVYSAHGSNFVLGMLKLASERPELKIVNDQVGCPTWARNLALVSERVLQAMHNNTSSVKSGGLFHYCDGDVVSWYDFAMEIFSMAYESGLLQKKPGMTAIASAAFPQVAQRPHYSVLDASAISKAFGVKQAGLKQSLRTCLEEL